MLTLINLEQYMSHNLHHQFFEYNHQSLSQKRQNIMMWILLEREEIDQLFLAILIHNKNWKYSYWSQSFRIVLIFCDLSALQMIYGSLQEGEHYLKQIV